MKKGCGSLNDAGRGCPKKAGWSRPERPDAAVLKKPGTASPEKAEKETRGKSKKKQEEQK